jgi:hypothetical protein
MLQDDLQKLADEHVVLDDEHARQCDRTVCPPHGFSLPR